jgi:hypothetical protein
MEVYAYQAKDKELVTWSTEMCKRAERRIGELIAELREAAKRATAGWQENWVRDGLPTLADEGIDKHSPTAPVRPPRCRRRSSRPTLEDGGGRRCPP